MTCSLALQFFLLLYVCILRTYRATFCLFPLTLFVISVRSQNFLADKEFENKGRGRSEDRSPGNSRGFRTNHMDLRGWQVNKTVKTQLRYPTTITFIIYSGIYYVHLSRERVCLFFPWFGFLSDDFIKITWIHFKENGFIGAHWILYLVDNLPHRS